MGTGCRFVYHENANQKAPSIKASLKKDPKIRIIPMKSSIRKTEYRKDKRNQT